MHAKKVLIRIKITEISKYTPQREFSGDYKIEIKLKLTGNWGFSMNFFI